MPATALKKYLPVIDWLPKYKARFWGSDIIAGLTVLALTVPENMAYAQLAGVPPEYGFFTSIAALIGYAVFGTGKQTVVAANSTIAIMSAAIVGTIAVSDPDKFLPLTFALALLTGLIYIIAGVVRLGAISRFFSTSVVTGFIFGLALVVIANQAHKLFGISVSSGDFFARAWEVLANLGTSNGWTLLIGASSLVLLFVLGKFIPRIPAALIALVLGILIVALLGLDEKGVSIVGQIPSGFPGFSFPGLPWKDWVELAPGALAIVLVGYAETLSIGREFGSKHDYEIDPNQELIALGAANVGSGLCQGFAVDASLSKSAANDEARAKTPMSSFISAGLLIATLLFLTPLFYYLPEAVLAAIVIHAVWSLLKVSELKRYWRISKPEFWLALATLLCILVFGILVGLGMAVLLSLALLIYRASRPHFSILGKDPDKNAYGALDLHPGYRKIPRLLMIRLDAPLFFGNAAFLRSQSIRLVKKTRPKPKVLIIDMEASYELDIASIDTLAEIKDDIENMGTQVWLTRVHGHVHDTIRKSKLRGKFGDKFIFFDPHDAVKLFRKKY